MNQSCTNCNSPNQLMYGNCGCNDSPQTDSNSLPAVIYTDRCHCCGLNSCPIPQGEPHMVTCSCTEDPHTVDIGMPGCQVCRYLPCKCGLCRSCRVYEYVQYISSLDLLGLANPRPKRTECVNGSVPDGCMMWATQWEECDTEQPIQATCDCPTCCIKTRCNCTKNRCKVVIPWKPKENWNSSVRVPVKVYEGTLRDAEEKLAELDRILMDFPIESPSPRDPKDSRKPWNNDFEDVVVVAEPQENNKVEGFKTRPQTARKGPTIKEKNPEIGNDNKEMSEVNSDLDNEKDRSRSPRREVQVGKKKKGIERGKWSSNFDGSGLLKFKEASMGRSEANLSRVEPEASV